MNDADRRLNGKTARVFSAQVLGKAVALEAGVNQVEFRYVPRAFYLGAIISAATATMLVLALARVLLLKRRLSAATRRQPE